MSKVYDDEVRFQYPENWKVDREATEEGWTVTVQSPGTAFLTIACDKSSPTVEEMAEAALTAMQSEYPAVEADAEVGEVAGQPAMGHSMSFFSLDLTNTCWTRALYTDAGTVLLLGQYSDIEQSSYGVVLDAIVKSMTFDE